MRWSGRGRQRLGLVVMTELLLDCLRDELALRLDGGATLADIQIDVIDVAQGPSEDERAALWLFAWAYSATRGGRLRRAPESVR